MTRHCVSVFLSGFAAFMTTPSVKDVPLWRNDASASGTLGGWEWMVTCGQKEFHSRNLAVSRRTVHIKGAGASMVILAEIVWVVESRGTMFVVRPLAGGQAVVLEVDMIMNLNAILERRRMNNWWPRDVD